MASEYLEHKLALLPDLPGIYMMKNINGHIIYVGKAKNLKNRVRSYFKSSHEGKTARLVSEIADFETIIVSNDKEAFLLEITMIQKHQPHYNIKLKQGTGYPTLKLPMSGIQRQKLSVRCERTAGTTSVPIPTFTRLKRPCTFFKKFTHYGAAMAFSTGRACTTTWGNA